MMFHGFYGVRINGCDKLAFSGGNNATPPTMGMKLVNELSDVIRRLGYVDALERWKRMAADLVVLFEGRPMTCASIITILSNGRCYSLGGDSLVLDSYICEWGYILNLDAETFEVYRGYQTKPHFLGRYSNVPLKERWHCSSEFYSCALMFEIPLPDLSDFKPSHYLCPIS